MQLSVYFTPTTALIGGLVLGTAAVGKFLATGRILGISGTLKGFVQGDVASWRVMFLSGMVGGGLLSANMLSHAAFDILPESFTLARSAVGGLLVGLGAAMGNGCTSGHGICGNARLSLRSAVYTVLFMASGVVSATLTRSAAAAGIAPKAAELLWPHNEALKFGLMLVSSAVVTMAALVGVAKQVQGHRVFGLVAEFTSGLLFALGLVYTGMVRPTKVIAFLSPTYPAWDLSLMFVMGGALIIALPGFQTILQSRRIEAPVCAPQFQLPAKHDIDLKLVLGGVLFGVGWGVSGMCPGPAVVAAVAKPVPQVLAYIAAMMAGMFLEGRVGEMMLGSKEKVAVTETVEAPAKEAGKAD